MIELVPGALRKSNHYVWFVISNVDSDVWFMNYIYGTIELDHFYDNAALDWEIDDD